MPTTAKTPNRTRARLLAAVERLDAQIQAAESRQLKDVIAQRDGAPAPTWEKQQAAAARIERLRARRDGLLRQLAGLAVAAGQAGVRATAARVMSEAEARRRAEEERRRSAEAQGALTAMAGCVAEALEAGVSRRELQAAFRRALAGAQ